MAGDLVVPLWVDAAHGGYRTLSHVPWALRLLGGASPGAVWSIVAITLAAAICVIAGLGGRWSALLASQGLLTLLTVNSHTGGAYDMLLLNALWLLVLSRSTATWSLDSRLRHRAWSRRVDVPAWPRYLVIVQLVIVYGSTGIQKISASWTPFGGFSALYYILQQPSWQRFNMDWVAYVYPLSQLGTAITWLWELTAPLLLLVLYYRATPDRGGRLRRLSNRHDLRKPFAAIGVTMHLLTLILMDLGPFSWVSLAFYPCLMSPSEIRSVVRRFRR